MDNKDKIILITHNQDKLIDTLAILTSKDDKVKIAKTFTTDIEFQGKQITEWKYFMSNNDLFLAFKNNALLAISTDENEISTGITKEEASSASIIPMSYSMLTNASPKTIVGMTICWIDSTTGRNKRISKDSMEIMKTYKKFPLLYFDDNDDAGQIANTIYRYLNSDVVEREIIINDCN